jgi:hypothetical protein
VTKRLRRAVLPCQVYGAAGDIRVEGGKHLPSLSRCDRRDPEGRA